MSTTVNVCLPIPEETTTPWEVILPAGGRLVDILGIHQGHLVLRVIVEDTWHPDDNSLISGGLVVVVGPKPPETPTGWVRYGSFEIALDDGIPVMPAVLWFAEELVSSISDGALMLAGGAPPLPTPRDRNAPSLN